MQLAPKLTDVCTAAAHRRATGNLRIGFQRHLRRVLTVYSDHYHRWLAMDGRREPRNG